MLTTKLIFHQNKRRIAVCFEPQKELIQRFKQLKGARWSATLKVWHLPDTEEYRKQFGISTYFNNLISQETIQKLEYFETWLRSKRYGESTIKTYTDVTHVFLTYFKDKQVEAITNDDVVLFNNEYILKRQLSSSYQNQFVNGIKLFFETVENRKIVVSLILRPRIEHHLPNVLSKQEVKAILEAPTNLKHRAMLSLIYACGLRRSELLNLQPKDILSDRHLLHIFQSKGKKDRVVPISDKTIEMLRSYYVAYRPKQWLFEGQEKGGQYSPKSLQNVLKQALEKANIKKPATLHWLRHSYATHLLENGTDIRYIQELLGHNNSRTTEIYTHVSNRDIQKIISPFDLL
jgi:integrase/recombinase XerD